MTTSRDPDQMIHAFLFEGAELLDDQVYDVVRAEIDQKRQRVVLGPWRVPTVSKFLPIGLGVAALIGVLFLGSQLIGSPSSSVGGPASQPPASAAPTAAASAAALATSPPSAPPLTQSFTSTVHGISVSYPDGWTARAATKPWTDRPGVRQFIDPGLDVLYDRVLTDHLFLHIVSRPIGDSAPEDWVAQQMAIAQQMSSGECTETEPIALDGATGLIGAEGCELAFVSVGSRGYQILLTTSDDDPAAVAPYDRAWFEEVLATVQLHPEDAIDAAP